MNERDGMNMGGSGEKFELPYYNNYPEAEPVFEFESSEEKAKKKKRKTAIIVWSIVLGCVLILASITLIILDHFIFFPSFTEAAEKTVSDIMPDTNFNFAKFEKEGQSRLGYNDGEIYISYLETHKKADSSVKLTVEDANNKESYNLVKKDKSFAVMYGDNWYGANSKNAEEAFASSAIKPSGDSSESLSEAESAYLLSYLKYLEKGSASDNDAKITANFIKKVFKSSTISLNDQFYGNYEILGLSRYVKSRAYAINNDNLSEFLNNLIAELKVADPTVQDAVKRTVNVNLGNGGMTFDDIIDMLESFVDEINKAAAFNIYFETCYSGKKISAILITNSVVYKSGSVDNSKLIIDFYANGAKIHSEEEFVSASESDGKSYIDVKDIQITIASTEDGSASYQIYMDDNGKVKQWKLVFDNTNNTAELVAALDGVETFRMTGKYSDTKEQLDINFNSLTVNGESQSNFQLIVTFYYKSTAIEMPTYKNIMTMSGSDLKAMRDNKFNLNIDFSDIDELGDVIDEFFGF